MRTDRQDNGEIERVVDSLRAELESDIRPNRWPIVPFAIAAAVLVMASAAIWYSIHRAALVDIASLHDRETAKEEEATGDILQSGRLPLPDFIQDLTPPRQVLMGKSSSGPNLELISPVATAVIDARPRFQWKRLEGDWTYVVRVFRPGFDVAAESGDITVAEWTPSADLPSGITYEWQISARRGSKRVTFPQPPEAPPRFRVVDPATSQRLRELAKNRGGVHLLLAIEYGKAGLMQDARRELQAELQRSRYPDAIERLIQSLDVKDR